MELNTVIPSASFVTEPTSHGFGKRVILRDQVIPHVTQVAIAELPAGALVSTHTHASMYEFFYSLDGAADYMVANEVYKILPGDAILVPPRVPHGIRVGDKPHRALYFGIAVNGSAEGAEIP